MAIYNHEGLQSLLNAALGDYQSLGFRLLMLDVFHMQLYYQDDPIATFGLSDVTIQHIRHACLYQLVHGEVS